MADPTAPKLNAWGQKLWDDVCESTTLDAAGYFILAEACRTADIIERLSGMLRGKTTEWVALAEEAVDYAEQAGEAIATVNLVVNPIISEVRQQRLALRTLLAQLKLGNVEAGTEGASAIDNLIASFALPD